MQAYSLVSFFHHIKTGVAQCFALKHARSSCLKVDNAVHWINLYPLDSIVCFLSGG